MQNGSSETICLHAHRPDDCEAGPDTSGPSSVHPLETSVQLGAWSRYRDFLASNCQPDMTAAARLFGKLDRRDQSSRLATFIECRQSAYFVKNTETQEVRIVSNSCRQRWCPLCLRSKRYIMRIAVADYLRTLNAPKFSTFTLKHSNAPLDSQITRLYDCFRELRRRKLFKSNCRGGVWFFQVKKSSSDESWHPHIHCLIDSKYIDQSELSDLWLSVTGNSPIVDIRAVRNGARTADYVARYASSPCRLADLDEPDRLELFDALHGRRVCGTWGSARSCRLTPQPPENPEVWEYLESFTVVASRARYDSWHLEIWLSWTEARACGVDPRPEPPPPKLTPMVVEPETYKQHTFKWGFSYGNDSTPE